MAIVTEAAELAGLCPEGTAAELTAVLKAYGLPTEAPFTTQQLLEGMLSDKKIEGKEINLILPRKIGCCTIDHMGVAEAQALLAGQGRNQ